MEITNDKCTGFRDKESYVTVILLPAVRFCKGILKCRIKKAALILLFIKTL